MFMVHILTESGASLAVKGKARLITGRVNMLGRSEIEATLIVRLERSIFGALFSFVAC